MTRAYFDRALKRKTETKKSKRTFWPIREGEGIMKSNWEPNEKIWKMLTSLILESDKRRIFSYNISESLI